MIRFSIIDAADQQWGAILNNRRVTMRLWWNQIANSWSFDLAEDDLPLLTGRRVVLGADMLAAFNLDLGQIWALDFKTGAYPGRTELPAGDVRLYHVSDEEVEAYLASV